MRGVRPGLPLDRRGTVLPMLAVCLIGLFAFTALAVDLGMLAVSRTECQNAADAAALAGCRSLNNNTTNSNSNLAAAVASAKAVAMSNTDMGANYTASQISEIDAGQYLYNSSSQTFAVYNGYGTPGEWTNVTNGSAQTNAPSSGSWTAMRVTISYTQPMYFLTVFGVTSMPTGAVAAAVHRPRDTAFVLDMTWSMAYASQFNFNKKSNNPDTLVPRFGHYSSTRTNCIQNTNQVESSGEAIGQNNYCIYTPSGPPLIRDFVYDPSNISNPATPAFPITSNTSSLLNAFHRWSPPESGASTAQYLGPVYNFSGYNAFDTTNTSGPTPAPDSFIDQFDVAGIPYVGDRYPRLDGKIWTTPSSTTANASGYPYPLTNPTPAWNDTTSGAATNALSYLGISSLSNLPARPGGGSYATNASNFRDPNWETYGYDLMMGPANTTGTYRNLTSASSPAGTPVNPTNVTAAMVRTSTDPNRFKGYSMGPGYWGKTFFIWPPDPRFSSAANVTSPNPTNPAFDNNGNPMCDWRRHFFLTSTGTPFNPQTTNINKTLFNTGSGQTLSGNTANYQINYPAVLKWIKSGPQVLPPNLRAGRVLYYSSIPDDVNTATATGQAQMDKVFWMQYINFVLGYGYTSSGYLYGQADSWSSASVNIDATTPPATIKYPWDTAASAPYMNYNDSPLRPRLHFWFGPLSMANFISGTTTSSNNCNPGTCHEAQCWQLKVGMNSVLTDLQNDHPNDTVGMVMFSYPGYNGIRVAQGQNYNTLKNSLFYPFSLISAINAGDVTTEECPFNTSLSSSGAGAALATNEIPNATGMTDPNTGLAYAFNLLSASSLLPTATYGPVSGRRGASKLIILETDGIPNTYRGTTGATGMIPSQHGYDTYYPTSTYISGDLGNGNATVEQMAYNVVQQITLPMASSGSSSGSNANSGLSLPNAPALVYPVAFGDLFDTTLSPSAGPTRTQALQFLANVASYGNTGTAGAAAPASGQIITGDYPTRLAGLQTCFQQIFQSGVTVTLIE